MIQAIKFLAKYTKHRLEGVKSPAEYYQKIGDDVVPTLNDAFANVDKPLWLNLGYWKDARTYKSACEDMARLLAKSGKLSKAKNLLDVGFGFGEQDLLWTTEFDVRHIEGVNITPLHVEVANKRKNQTSVCDRINYQIGNATKLPFENNIFDRVVALESAFHFDPRTEFFKESHRVLENGGMLVIADMVSANGETVTRKSQKLGRQEIYIPDENAITKQVYINQLKEAGFEIVTAFSIAKYVYAGARKYFYARAFGKNTEQEIKLKEKDFCSSKGAKVWGRAYGLSDYVVFVAQKKGAN